MPHSPPPPPLLPLARAQEAPASAAAELPPADRRPFPALDPGMHTATINRLAVDRAGRWLVTASDDKTARVWDLANGGRLAAVLRVPVGEGNEGKLYAVALSPDGALVALGGFTGSAGTEAAIYLFERAGGRLLQRLGGLPNAVLHLAFSADGHRLAAALGGANGLRVYEAGAGGRWAQVAADAAYGDDSYSVEFDASGRLLATSYDGDLRLYTAGQRGLLTPLQRRPAPGGSKPFFARFSPDGRRIAVGFDDSTAVAVLDGASLAPLPSPDTSAIRNGNVSSVDWSADGQRLLATGTYGQADGTFPLVAWPSAGGAPQLLLLGMTDTVMDLRPLADGRLVFGGGDPAWGVLDAQLQRTPLFRGPPVLDHRNNPGGSIGSGGVEAFRLAPAGEGRWLEFRAVTRDASGPRARLVRFDLADRRLLLPTSPATAGLAPRSTGLPIDGWRSTTAPTQAGKPLPLQPYERSRSLAISTDRQRFALGSGWAVRLFDAEGQRRWRTPTPDIAWLVNLSPDGRFVVAALGDGTIRWYRTQQEGAAAAGSEALALFVHPDLQRWILWTPEGFYDASPGGDQLFGYQLNNGREAAGTFIRSAQLQKQFFRPDLIARRLSGRPDDEAAIAAAVAEVGDVRTSLSLASLPPAIRIVGQRTLPEGDTEITYELIDRGGGIGPVQLRLNDKLVEGRANPPRPGLNVHRVPLPPGRMKLNLTAYGRSGLVASLPAVLELEGAAPSEAPTLHLLAVGISAYRDKALQQGVRFAAGDARAFRDALLAAGRAPTTRVAEPVLLTDAQASGAGIRAALAAMAGRVRLGDLFVLYMAGHGVAVNGDYTFLPQDLLYRNNESLREGLGGEELSTLLSRINSNKTVVVLDTCSSGGFRLPGRSLGEKGAIDKLARQSGQVVFAAAGDERLALESPDNQRGLYTGALLRALAGAADTDRDGLVGVREAADYVEKEVQRLSQQLFGYEQTPMFNGTGQNFPFSRSGGR